MAPKLRARVCCQSNFFVILVPSEKQEIIFDYILSLFRIIFYPYSVSWGGKGGKHQQTTVDIIQWFQTIFEFRA